MTLLVDSEKRREDQAAAVSTTATMEMMTNDKDKQRKNRAPNINPRSCTFKQNNPNHSSIINRWLHSMRSMNRLTTEKMKMKSIYDRDANRIRFVVLIFFSLTRLTLLVWLVKWKRQYKKKILPGISFILRWVKKNKQRQIKLKIHSHIQTHKLNQIRLN